MSQYDRYNGISHSSKKGWGVDYIGMWTQFFGKVLHGQNSFQFLVIDPNFPFRDILVGRHSISNSCSFGMFWYVTKGYRSSSITSHVLSLFLDTLMLWTNIAIAHRPFDVFSIDGSCSHLCPVGPYVQYGVCTVTYVYQKNEPTCKHIHIYI